MINFIVHCSLQMFVRIDRLVLFYRLKQIRRLLGTWLVYTVHIRARARVYNEYTVNHTTSVI